MNSTPIVPSPALCAAIWHVWQAIAPDLEGMVPDNASAIESVCDADRLDPAMQLQPDAVAHAEYRAMIKAHGWTETQAALAAWPHTQLV